MKLPDALLRSWQEDISLPRDGDIEIAHLVKRENQKRGMQKVKDRDGNISLFDGEYNLTVSGLRALNVLRNLQESERIKIVRFLLREPNSVAIIADHLGKTQPAASHHLGLLRTEGLLNLTRGGKFNIYSISEECRDAVKGLIQYLRILSNGNQTLEATPITEKQQQTTLKLVAQKMRMQILQILHDRGEVIVNDMCKILHIKQPGVSHHLAEMRAGNILSSRKEGKTNPYTLADEGKEFFTQIADTLESMFSLGTRK